MNIEEVLAKITEEKDKYVKEGQEFLRRPPPNKEFSHNDIAYNDIAYISFIEGKVAAYCNVISLINNGRF